MEDELTVLKERVRTGNEKLIAALPPNKRRAVPLGWRKACWWQ